MDDAIAAAGNATLLDYAMDTAPSPLQVSPKKGDPTVAEIQIPISNGGDAPVYCDSITFVLPVGEAAQDLLSEGAAKVMRAAISPSDQWEVNPGAELGEFVAKPKEVQFRKMTAAGLLLQLRNIDVSKEIGSFAIKVTESSSKHDSDFTLREGEYKIAKFPYGFYFSDFRALQPVVKDGEAVTLEWIGSEIATYTILYGSAGPIDVSEVRQWSTPQPPGLHVDTTFILKAAVSVKDEPSIEHYLSTTVMVANPDLQATSVTVTGESNLEGPTTVGAGTDPSTLTVKGPLRAEKNVEASGDLSGASLGLTGGATITGALAVHGSLQAFAGVSMKVLGQPSGQTPGTYLAPSDGFVVGTVNGAGIDPTAKCFGWVDAWYSGAHAWATGGNVVSWLDLGTWSNHWEQANLSNSFLLPVPSGTTYTLRWAQGDDVAPAYEFLWIPLAAAAAEGEVPTRIGDVGAMPMPDSPGVVRRSAPGASARPE